MSMGFGVVRFGDFLAARYQSLLERDGRSLIVASLDHNQMAELYVVRRELEGVRLILKSLQRLKSPQRTCWSFTSAGGSSRNSRRTGRR